MPSQELEEREFTRGQTDGVFPSLHPQRRWVQDEIADLDPWAAVLEASPTERTDPGAEFIHAERLGEVVIRPPIEAGDAILHIVEGGQHQDRAGEAPSPQGGTDRKAVDTRQDHIEDDKLVRVGRHPVESVPTVTHEIDSVAIRRQDGLDRIGDGRFIFDDQDSQDLSSP